jgi:hypothetical protein
VPVSGRRWRLSFNRRTTRRAIRLRRPLSAQADDVAAGKFGEPPIGHGLETFDASLEGGPLSRCQPPTSLAEFIRHGRPFSDPARQQSLPPRGTMASRMRVEVFLTVRTPSGMSLASGTNVATGESSGR